MVKNLYIHVMCDAEFRKLVHDLAQAEHYDSDSEYIRHLVYSAAENRKKQKEPGN